MDEGNIKPDEREKDRTWHGTRVAGIIAALENKFAVVGVAPEAFIYSLWVFGKKGVL
jgi:subtilisin family serine protease